MKAATDHTGNSMRSRVPRRYSFLPLCALCLGCSAFAQTLPPGQIYDDVPLTGADSQYFNATTTMYQLGITRGCAYDAGGQALDFCPDVSITREDAATFMVRSWSIRIWNDPEAFQINAPPSATPYFVDVPSSDPQFLYVQKLYELGITSGVATGVFCPNPTDNGFNETACTAEGSAEGLVENVQMAVFVARARALSDNGCIGQYTTMSEPYVTSTNPACTLNNFTWSTNPYFIDVGTGDNWFKYVQRLGDLDAYMGEYTPTPYAGCGSCVFTEGNLITRGNAAIEIVLGIGLDPRSILSMNAVGYSGGSSYYSTPATTTTAFTYTMHDQPFGANDIGYAQFYLADSSGNAHCEGDWGAPSALALYSPGDTFTSTSGFGSDLDDNFSGQRH